MLTIFFSFGQALCININKKTCLIIALRIGPIGLGLQCQRGGPPPSSTRGLARHTSRISAAAIPLAGLAIGPSYDPTEFLC